MNEHSAFSTFLDPPHEFGPIPFWFWNDDLDEAEVLRQLHAFHQAGFGGVLPHARVGLSRRVGYLTDEFFRLIRLVVAEAAKLEMKIILYDEASYPSGSANGAVVAQNPDFASKAIGLWKKEIKGPYRGFWRPNTGRALLDEQVCAVLGRQTEDGGIDPGSLSLLEPNDRDIIAFDVPEGDWQVLSVWQTHSGGHIRGAFAEQESGHATAPAAGDILSPAAVACFIEKTHEQYYAHLKEYFGSTIIAMFTDEPSIFGKGALRPSAAKPYTRDFTQWLEGELGYDPRPWLPALWLDYGAKETAQFRQAYSDAVYRRLHQVFYRAQSQWCAKRGIALTGHPAASNDMAALRYFQLPGQDMVWRYIEPEKKSALEGDHSVAAKAATSGARLAGSDRVLTEVCGAYGWHLSLDETKWLFDWHLVRGNNLINLHAAFYSIRGRRAWESEPDMGLHNVWWPHFGRMARYTQRLCWLLSGGEHVCQLAIVGDGQDLPWQGAKVLYQNQLDFLYLDSAALGAAKVEAGVLSAGSQSYKALVLEGNPPLEPAAQAQIDHFKAGGGLVLSFSPDLDLVQSLEKHLPRDFSIDPAHPDLRVLHYRKLGLDFYLLVNEGPEQIEATAVLATVGEAQIWDPWSGGRQPAAGSQDSGMLHLPITLERRQSLVLMVDPSSPFTPVAPKPKPQVRTLPIPTGWTVTDATDQPVPVSVPGDWAQLSGRELFTGTLTYQTQIHLPPAEAIWLDLGAVGDLAEVHLNGQLQGVALWAPYRIQLKAPPGTHQLTIKVTNSMANAFDGRQLPSGLLQNVNIDIHN